MSDSTNSPNADQANAKTSAEQANAGQASTSQANVNQTSANQANASQPIPQSTNQGTPNHGFPNQGFPNQGFPNQGYPNQGFPNQGFPNQGFQPYSNQPYGQYPNQPFQSSPKYVSPSDLGLLEKLGKSYLGVYIQFLILILLVIIAVAFAVLNGGLDPDMMRSSPAILVIFGIVMLAFGIYSLYVWIRFYICVWNTPESVVHGAGIGRVFVILGIVSGIIAIGVNVYSVNNPGQYRPFADPNSTLLVLLNAILNVVSIIVYMVYLNRLAIAVRSQRVQSCVKWVAYGFLIYFILVFVGGIASAAAAPQIGSFIILIGGICGLVAAVCYLNSYIYMSKDLAKFTQYQYQRLANQQARQNANQQPGQQANQQQF